MKKLLKKLTLLSLLVIAMVAIVPTVFAAISPDNQTGSITVSNLETDKSVNVKLYRIMDTHVLNGQPQEPVFTWTDTIATWIKGNAKLDNTKYFVDATKSNAVKEFSAADAKTLYEELAKAIRAGEVKDSAGTVISPDKSASTTCTGEGENTTCPSSLAFTELTQGAYYILADGGMKIYSPTSANVIPKYVNGEWNLVTESASGTNVAVSMKASKPSVDKKVNNKDNTTANIGDTLTYTLTITVPTYPTNAINKKFVITDKLSAGLTYNKDAVIRNQAGETVSQTVSFDATNNQITIDFSGENYSKIEGQTTITVTYTATLNEKAKVTTEANSNEAKLVYNNDPYNTSSNDTDSTDISKVYTYGIKINKKGIDEDVNGLAGVIFEISKGSNVLCFATTSTAGEYIYTGVATVSGDTKTCTTGSSTEVTTPTGGHLVLKGLDEGVYNATETFAPNGYVKLQAPLQFTIQDLDNNVLDGTLTAVEEGVTVDGSYVSRDVVNNKGVTLPVTGGIGTLIFSILGIVFMGIAAFLVRSVFKGKKVENI